MCGSRSPRDAIGQGLSALPRVLVPYNGIDYPIRTVIVLGAGVLLLDAALMLAFAPRALGDACAARRRHCRWSCWRSCRRRSRAPAPVPARARSCSCCWRPSCGPIALRRLGATAAVGVVVARRRWRRCSPRRRSTRAALDQLPGAGRSIGRRRTASSFDWSQHYGPLNWPRTGHEVLDVQASSRRLLEGAEPRLRSTAAAGSRAPRPAEPRRPRRRPALAGALDPDGARDAPRHEHAST